MVSKQKTIYNFNLRFFCILLALILLSMIGSITVYADTGTSVEAEHSDGSYTSSGGKWYATYSRSGGYKDKAFSFTFSNATVVAQSPVQPRRRFLVVAVC